MDIHYQYVKGLIVLPLHVQQTLSTTRKAVIKHIILDKSNEDSSTGSP